MIQEGSHPQHAAKNICATQTSTISMNTDTRIPSSPGNDRFQIEPKLGENMSLPMNQTRLRPVSRPQLVERSDGIIHVPKVSPHLNPIGMSDGTTDSRRTVLLLKPTGTNCRVSSFEDKLHSMPGSIHTFDDPAEAEVDVSDGAAPSPVPTVSDDSQCAATATLGAVSYDSRLVGLEEITAACLETLLVGLVGKLLEMGSCILRTMAKVLRVSYAYSETGSLKMEGMLVLDVLRSVIYALIWGAIAVALTRVVALAVKVGACILWVLKGIFWVLI